MKSTRRTEKIPEYQVDKPEVQVITLSELITKLQANYSDRTVRRWLNQLIDEGLVTKSGHTRNAKYLVVKTKNYVSDNISSCFGSDSLRAIDQIAHPLYERHPVAYNEKWFASYNPNVSCYLSNGLRELLFRTGLRANSKSPAGTYAHQIFNRLLIDLSYNSSRLEGNTYSLLDTERLLLHGDSAEGKLDEEKVRRISHSNIY